MAYLSLSICYGNLGGLDRTAENVRKAYDLRDKVSEPERLFIEGFYYSYGTGELEKARGVFDLWRQTYPNMFVPYLNLGDISGAMGDWESALLWYRADPASGAEIRVELCQPQRSPDGSEPAGRG